MTCTKHHVSHYLFLLPWMTFTASIPSLLRYDLSLCFLVATLIIFFSVFGAITVLCGTINTASACGSIGNSDDQLMSLTFQWLIIDCALAVKMGLYDLETKPTTPIAHRSLLQLFLLQEPSASKYRSDITTFGIVIALRHFTHRKSRSCNTTRMVEQFFKFSPLNST
jgi:hypothetical protein